jgi:hypothetical protein
MERGERDRVRAVFKVLERVKAAPRKDAWGEPEADVVVEQSVESVEDWSVCTLLGWFKLVVSESRRAVKGEGNGAGTLLIVVNDVDDDDAISSIVVSRPSK